MKKIAKKIPANSALGKMSVTRKWILTALLLVVLMGTLPVFIVLFIGLLPTITVLITDPKNSNKLIIVGCFNLAGVFIYLLNGLNHLSVAGAFQILGNIFNLIIMLGSAAIGLILYCELPGFFVYITHNSTERRLKQIDDKLKALAEEWGDELITTSEPETTPTPSR